MPYIITNFHVSILLKYLSRATCDPRATCLRPLYQILAVLTSFFSKSPDHHQLDENEGKLENLKEVFEEALKLDREVFNKRDPLFGKTCLHTALEHGHDDDFLKMVKKGADFFIQDISEVSCFDLAVTAKRYILRVIGAKQSSSAKCI